MTTCPSSGLYFSIQISLKSISPLIDWQNHLCHLIDCPSEFFRQKIFSPGCSCIEDPLKYIQAPLPICFSLRLILLACLTLLSVFSELHMGAPALLCISKVLYIPEVWVVPFSIRVQPPFEFHFPRTSWWQTLIWIIWP